MKRLAVADPMGAASVWAVLYRSDAGETVCLDVFLTRAEARDGAVWLANETPDRRERYTVVRYARDLRTRAPYFVAPSSITDLPTDLSTEANI